MRATEKPSFSKAVQAHLLGLQAELRDHPSFEELEYYGRDGLSADHRDEVAEHLAICRNCGTLFRYGVLEGQEAEDPEGNGAVGLDAVDLHRAWVAVSRQLDNPPQPWESLSDYLARGRPPLEEVLSLGHTVAQALAVCHAGGQVVRDLRPETILLDPAQRQARFLDLGLAASLDRLPVGSGRSAQALLAGTIRCSSPEQVAGERLDPRSNLFSLGSVLYEMTTGTAPFQGPTALETASRVLVLEAPPVAQLRPNMPAALDTLLGLLLQKDADKRPRTATRVAAVLEAIGKGVADPLRALQEAEDLGTEIEALYERIDTLVQKRQAGGDGERRIEIESEITAAFDQLRKLQKIEATRFREEFEAGLAMPVDAGEQILGRTRALREKLEGLTAAHFAAR